MRALPGFFVCRTFSAGAILIFALLLPAGSRAALIAGDLSIVGSLSLGAGTIDFVPAGGGTGSFSVVTPSTGSFVPLLGTSGTIQDLDAATEPVNAPLSLASFMIFAANPALSFTLSFIDPGVFGSAACALAPAIGQTCTLPAGTGYGSAFNLVNTTSGSTLSFGVAGKAVDGADVSDVTGIFTAQFAGLSYQQVLATLGGGGSAVASYSAAFHAIVPEPTTAACVALGTLALALARRRSG